MEVDLRARIEIEAIASILDTLDYYQVLQVPREAPLPALEKAFASESKRFHPDRYYGMKDADLSRQVTRIYRKVAEAWSVLKDPELKAIYDRRLRTTAPDSPSAEPTAAVHKGDLERERDEAQAPRVCSTRQGQKFYDLVHKARLVDDYNGVVMNLKFALDFEPENETLKQQLALARTQLEEHRKKTKNPYKIRIV